MSVSAPAISAPTPAKSDFAETAALIKEIATEARASGKALTYDADAPEDAPEAAEAEEAQADAPVKAEKTAKAEDPADAEEEAEEPSTEEEEAEEEPTEAAPGELDVAAIKAALASEEVDLEALAKALNVDPSKLRMTPSQFKAARIERRKAQQTLARAQELSTKLEDRFGDQGKALKAAAEGDLQPAIDFIEATFGMSWNELNTMVADLLKGKPIKDLEQKRELSALRKKAAEVEAAEKRKGEEASKTQAIADAKAWIASTIKADPLATSELNQQLLQAGMPTIVDLVFDEMHANFAKGLTDPVKALDRVKAKLTKQARALQAAGVLPKPETPKPKPLSASKPRASAQAGSAGNGRPMTDAELRRAVLKEAGLLK
jgi:hypothetical protein